PGRVANRVRVEWGPGVRRWRSPRRVVSGFRHGQRNPWPDEPGSDSAGCPVAFASVPALRLGSLAGGPRGRPGPAPRRVRGLPSFDQKPKPGIVAKEWEAEPQPVGRDVGFSEPTDRKSTRLNSSHQIISYAVFCLKK